MSGANIQVIIPMAGQGERFKFAGYQIPKPLLPIHGVEMFKWVIANLYDPRVESYTLIVSEALGIELQVEKISKTLGIKIHLKKLAKLTDGPATTVSLGLRGLKRDQPLVVANSDQYVDCNIADFYNTLQENSTNDGTILTMNDSDPKWSYVKLDSDQLVSEVQEKRVISEIATVGIYGFKSVSLFADSYIQMKDKNIRTNGELYVAPMYNELIANGYRIGQINLGQINKVMHGFGIPRDYENFCKNPQSKELQVRIIERLSGKSI